jgi:FkbH-like protein
MTDIDNIKQQIESGEYPGALSNILNAIDPGFDYPDQRRYARLLRALPTSELGLRPLRLAFLGTSTLDHLIEVLPLYLARDGFDVEIYQSEFDTVFQSALDKDSNLYKFQPDIIWIFTNNHDIELNLPLQATEEDVDVCIDNAIARLANLWSAIEATCSARIIQNNVEMPLARPYGNYNTRVAGGTTAPVRAFNRQLGKTAPDRIMIFDLDELSATIGRCHWFDERYWFHSKHAFSLNCTGRVAHEGARLISAIKGRARKCLVLDLDNTLWGGVIGDDGMAGILLGQGSADGEAFLAFQQYVKTLRDRGVILALCSKNEIDIAAEAFDQHPDMILQRDDFAVFICNWNNKADNLRQIAGALDIGLDSFVFVDDNPAERALVRAELPMVAVPELPRDPAGYVRCLDTESYFEMTAFSDEDIKRGTMYRENAQRKVLQAEFTNIDLFLQDLSMQASFGEFDPFNLPRILQLINKSNQFHLTTTRYGELELTKMIAEEACEGWWFKLTDRFGDNGLISAVIVKQTDDVLTVDTWAMSCRVLSRGMEEFIHNHLIDVAKRRSARILRGHYIPTNKNKLVKDLYGRLGWQHVANEADKSIWELTVSSAVRHSTCIEAGIK